jgi:glycosyltransferase involved in cell wall biosynthesis
MRILFALHAYLPEGRGGTEVHVHTLAKRLQGQHAVRVVCREGDPKKPNYAVTRDTFEGVEVVRINHLHGWAPDFEWLYKDGRVHELFERELVDFKPDLVHVHHLTGLSTTIVETIKAGGLPLVMTLHDFWTVCPRGQRITKELEICENVDRNICFHCLGGIWPQIFRDRERQRTELDSRGRLAPRPLAEFDRHLGYILNLADVLIAPSWFHRERMLDFPIDPERIVALPHGLDPAPYGGIERKPRPVRKIGYIGSVIPIKGAHVLVDAFRQLARPDLELHVHGDAFAFHDDRDYLDRLKSRAIGLRNVVFHGAYLPTDLPRILSEIDVLVVPSLWWETFCLTIREGQLAGVPVIASDLGAMREALDGEECGLLFHAGDSRELAERIDRICRDDELRARLSHCQGAVKTLDQYVPELLALYERAQAESAARQGTIVVAPPSFPPSPPNVKVSWSLPDAPAIAVETAGPPSEREMRFAISDKATGRPLGTLAVEVESVTPISLRAGATTAAVKPAAAAAAPPPQPAPRAAPPPAPPRAAAPRPAPSRPAPPRDAAPAERPAPAAPRAPAPPPAMQPPQAPPTTQPPQPRGEPAPQISGNRPARRTRRHRRERRHRPTQPGR